jgi:hypothetical protein
VHIRFRHRFARHLSPFPDVPADSRQVNKGDFSPSGFVAWAPSRTPGYLSGRALDATTSPPGRKILDVEANHVILRKRFIVVLLKDELSSRASETGIPAVFPDFLETQISKELAAGIVIFPARDEW